MDHFGFLADLQEKRITIEGHFSLAGRDQALCWEHVAIAVGVGYHSIAYERY
jgi:hypothetical protein